MTDSFARGRSIQRPAALYPSIMQPSVETSSVSAPRAMMAALKLAQRRPTVSSMLSKSNSGAVMALPFTGTRSSFSEGSPAMSVSEGLSGMLRSKPTLISAPNEQMETLMQRMSSLSVSDARHQLDAPLSSSVPLSTSVPSTRVTTAAEMTTRPRSLSMSARGPPKPLGASTVSNIASITVPMETILLKPPRVPTTVKKVAAPTPTKTPSVPSSSSKSATSARSTPTQKRSSSVPPASSGLPARSRSATPMRSSRTATPSPVGIVNYNDPYERAADAILNADFILISAGAGFSADSGLAVYKDIADVPAYHRMSLTYADLCEPRWITQDPEIFYGFWGSCFNSYMEKEPHEGYLIVKKWVDSLFLGPNKRSARRAATRPSSRMSSSVAAELPHPFFVYTSNVDHYFPRMGFPEERVFEIHGHIMTWQCSSPCCQSVWDISDSFRFDVNRDTMRCPRFGVVRKAPSPSPPPMSSSSETPSGSPSLSPVPADLSSDSDPDEPDTGKPVFPRVHQSSTPTPIYAGAPTNEGRVLVPQQASVQSQPSSSSDVVRNHISCRFCPRAARPNILMFDDGEWVELQTPLKRYNSWVKSVKQAVKAGSGRLVIIEAGCGIRVPTVRENSERLLKDTASNGTTLIRINPDYPKNSSNVSSTVSIQDTALSAVRKIEAILSRRCAELGLTY